MQVDEQLYTIQDLQISLAIFIIQNPSKTPPKSVQQLEMLRCILKSKPSSHLLLGIAQHKTHKEKDQNLEKELFKSKLGLGIDHLPRLLSLVVVEVQALQALLKPESAAKLEKHKVVKIRPLKLPPIVSAKELNDKLQFNEWIKSIMALMSQYNLDPSKETLDYVLNYVKDCIECSVNIMQEFISSSKSQAYASWAVAFKDLGLNLSRQIKKVLDFIVSASSAAKTPDRVVSIMDTLFQGHINAIHRVFAVKQTYLAEFGWTFHNGPEWQNIPDPVESCIKTCQSIFQSYGSPNILNLACKSITLKIFLHPECCLEYANLLDHILQLIKSNNIKKSPEVIAGLEALFTSNRHDKDQLSRYTIARIHLDQILLSHMDE